MFFSSNANSRDQLRARDLAPALVLMRQITCHARKMLFSLKKHGYERQVRAFL
jgi:hypothetical protein